MSYKIAVASNDGVYVNAHFGSSILFYIVEVNDDGSYIYKEERIVSILASDQVDEDKIASCGSKENSCINNSYKNDSCENNYCENNCCGNNSSCGNSIDTSCGNESRLSYKNNISGNSCGRGHSDAQIEQRVSLIDDCRCLLCKKIGPSAERQLERKAITTFQIDYKIDDVLVKIIEYYSKIDNHISLRKG